MSYNQCNYLGCKNKKRQNPFRFFKFPIKENDRCEEWIRNCGNLKLLNVHRQQLKEMSICEVHFNEESFVNVTHHRLIRSAVPRHFKNFKESSKVSQLKQKSVLNDIPLINIRMKVESHAKPAYTRNEIQQEIKIEAVEENETETAEENEIETVEEKFEPEKPKLIKTENLLYSGLLYQTAELLIPPKWCRVIPKGSDYVVFANFMFNECSSLVPYKEVCISSKGNVYYNCCGKEIVTNFAKKFKSVSHLTNTIKDFDEKTVCEGSVASGRDSFHTYKDSLGTWRDTLCPIIFKDDRRRICQFCRRIGITNML